MTDLFDDIALPSEPPAVDMRMPMTLVLHFTVEELEAVEHLAVLRKTDPLTLIQDLVRQALPSQNGHAFEVSCFGCGKKFLVKRRPVPGRRSWCETCKAAGEPAAQRARDYRSRKEVK